MPTAPHKTMVRMIVPGLGFKDILDDMPVDPGVVPCIGDTIVSPSMDEFREHKGEFPQTAYRVIDRVISFDKGTIRVVLLLDRQSTIPEWAASWV